LDQPYGHMECRPAPERRPPRVRHAPAALAPRLLTPPSPRPRSEFELLPRPPSPAPRHRSHIAHHPTSAT
jgi:hypothetical protein